MELAVLWVVLIAAGAFVLGLVGGWLVGRRARTAPVAAPLTRPATTPGPVPESHPDPETAAAESTPEPSPPSATGRERDHHVRCADIIGIEAENASLRAVAGRVPGLERRVRDLEATLEDRTATAEPVIDLTGPEPVVRPSGAEVTAH